MSHRALRCWKLIVGLYLFFAFPPPAFADNCSGLSDCYGTILAIVLALLGLALLITAPYWFPALLSRAVLSAALRALLSSALRSRLAALGARVAARMAARSWHRATFTSAWRSVVYHWGKHGAGRTIGQYTRDAARFFQQNRQFGRAVTLRDGSPGIYIRLGRGRPGGYFTPNGKIVTFWYR